MNVYGIVDVVIDVVAVTDAPYEQALYPIILYQLWKYVTNTLVKIVGQSFLLPIETSIQFRWAAAA